VKSLQLLATLVGIVGLVGCLPLPADMVRKAAPSNDATPATRSDAAAPMPPTPPGVEIVSAPVPPGQATSAAVAPAASAARGGQLHSGRLWVVVKNLNVSSGISLASEISADWEVVQGSPEPGAQYVLRVSDGESGSIVERYVDFDVDLNQRSGSVREGVRGPTFGIRGGIIAVVGKSHGLGRDEIDEVSGRCRVGGQSEAPPPPTVVEAAGVAAQGMPIALANPRNEGRGIGSPRGGWSVDYNVQGNLSPGERYFWIVKDASGDGVEFDVTTDLAIPGRSHEGTLSGSSFRPLRLSGQLKMYIERRGFGIRDEGSVVSNTVTLK
jgi:hypothetical protein